MTVVDGVVNDWQMHTEWRTIKKRSRRSVFRKNETVICEQTTANRYYLPVVMLPAIVVKRPCNAVEIVGIAAIKQRAIAEAMRPYSIAVAPDSSLRNLFIFTLQMLLTAPIRLGLAVAWLPVDMSPNYAEPLNEA